MSTKAQSERPAPDEDRDTTRALRLWITLARAHRAITAHAAADARRHGLTLTEFGVLELLHHRGRQLLGDIQRRLLVSSGGITFLVDRLVEKGLVERQKHSGDRRARYAALTPAGEQLLRRIFPDHAARIRWALSGVTAAEQDALTALLKALGLAAESSLGEDAAGTGLPVSAAARP